jgi:hypothetical protein
MILTDAIAQMLVRFAILIVDGVKPVNVQYMNVGTEKNDLVNQKGI